MTILSEAAVSEVSEHASQSVPMVSTSTPGLSAPAVDERDDMFLDTGDRSGLEFTDFSYYFALTKIYIN